MLANNIIRVVRPNLDLINQLRSQHKQPNLRMGERPEAVRNIVIADDELPLAKILARIIRGQISDLSGKTTNIVSLSKIGLKPDIDDNPHIYSAVTIDETTQVADHVLNPKMKVDMLFTDFNMIGITGEIIARKLRGNGYNGFIIGITGKPCNIELFYGANADLVIEKPFDPDIIKDLFSDIPLSWISQKAQKYALWLTDPEQAVRLSIIHSYRPSSSFNTELRAAKIIEYALSDSSFEVHFTREEIDSLFKKEVLAKDASIKGNSDELLNNLEFWAHVIHNKLTPLICAVQEIEECLKSEIVPQAIQATIGEIVSEVKDTLRELKIIEDWIYHNARFMLKVVADWKAQNPDIQL